MKSIKDIILEKLYIDKGYNVNDVKFGHVFSVVREFCKNYDKEDLSKCSFIKDNDFLLYVNIPNFKFAGTNRRGNLRDALDKLEEENKEYIANISITDSGFHVLIKK